jgi:hypothetical protein
MTLWHCGVHVYQGKLYRQNPSVHVGSVTAPCMHKTREAARACPNHGAYSRGGDGTTAPTAKGTI